MYRWVCPAADCTSPKSVRLGNGRPLIALRCLLLMLEQSLPPTRLPSSVGRSSIATAISGLLYRLLELWSKARGYVATVAYVLYFFERYVRTLMYSILVYVNKNRIRSWHDEIRIISHGCYQCQLPAVLEKKEGRVLHAPATDSPTSCRWVGRATEACTLDNASLSMVVKFWS